MPSDVDRLIAEIAHICQGSPEKFLPRLRALLRAAVRMRKEVYPFTSADYATPEVRAARSWDKAVREVLGAE